MNWFRQRKHRHAPLTLSPDRFMEAYGACCVECRAGVLVVAQEGARK